MRLTDKKNLFPTTLKEGVDYNSVIEIDDRKNPKNTDDIGCIESLVAKGGSNDCKSTYLIRIFFDRNTVDGRIKYALNLYDEYKKMEAEDEYSASAIYMSFYICIKDYLYKQRLNELNGWFMMKKISVIM